MIKIHQYTMKINKRKTNYWYATTTFGHSNFKYILTK